MQLGIPLIIFSCAACEPAHSTGVSLCLKEGGDPCCKWYAA